jgi:hypothetical protein
LAQSSNTLHVRPAAAGTGVDTPAQSVPVAGGGTALAPGYVSLNAAGDVVNPATEDTLEALNDKLPSQAIPGLLPVDTLGTPGVPRVQATSGTAANITLTLTCRRVSMFATQGTWYSISGTATATSHYIGAGERLDFDVPANTAISVLRETTDGSIRITELV